MPPFHQLRIPAVYMRGGTSKGVFFRLQDLPKSAQTPGPTRDSLMLRIIGSPDPYGKHIDGMGGAISSNSKVVIIDKSNRPNHDVDYLFGQVSIDKPHIDWSGNCGNLAAAVGPFAIKCGFIDTKLIPKNGILAVKIWQTSTEKTIIAQVPIINGEVQEIGDFELDGVPFPAAEIKLEYVETEGASEKIFPTGNFIDELEVPGIGILKSTLVNVGIPTVFVQAEEMNFQGTELQSVINNDPETLKLFETIRTYAALKMGIIKSIDEISNKQHVPKIAFVSKAKDYIASSGKHISSHDIDLNVRAFSMGKLHHAMPGTVSIAIGAATIVPGTIVNQVAGSKDELKEVRIGHPSGTLKVGVEIGRINGEWCMTKAIMSRSARVIMEGWVRVPSVDI